MSFVDIIILATLAALFVKGLLRGLLKELCALAGLVLGAMLAFRFQGELADGLVNVLRLPPVFAAATAFLAIFLTVLIIFLLAGHLLSRSAKLVFLGGLNRVAGGLFGLAQALVLLAVLLFAFSLRPMPAMLAKSFERSQLAPPFVRLGEALAKGGSRIYSTGKVPAATDR